MGNDGEPVFKLRSETADASTMNLGILPVHDGETGLAGGWRSSVDLGQLTHDESIVGLTMDQVSVVRVGDRVLVVPVPLRLAEESGFDMVATSPEALFAIGVRPSPAEQVPVARPTDADPSERWSALVDEVPREPEVPVAEGGVAPDVGGDFMVEPARQQPDDVVGADAGEAVGADAGEVVGADAGEAVGADAGEAAAAAVDNLVVRAEVLDTTVEDLAIPIQTARPEAVPGPDRPEWPVDGASPTWPDVERRISDRREGPSLAWGQPGSFLPMTQPVVVVTDAGLVPAHRPGTVVPVAEIDAADLGDAQLGPHEIRAVHARSIKIALDPVPDEREEPVAALVEVALPGSPTHSFGLRVAPGDVVVITGPTGSGKSSLLRVLAGFDAPVGGSVTVGGERLDVLTDERRSVRDAVRSGFVSAVDHLVPDLTVVENVELPLLVGGLEPRDARAATEALLERWCLDRIAARPGGSLSTTEERCVLLARALVADGPLLLLDDPTLGIDAEVAADVIALLLEQAARGTAVVIATTDPRVVLSGVRVLALEGGDVVRDFRVPAAAR